MLAFDSKASRYFYLVPWSQAIAEPNYVTLHQVTLSGGALQTPDALPGRRIEFIGDTASSGFCNLCHVQPTLADAAAASHYDSWGSQTCRLLNADCHHVAWTGFGMLDRRMPDVHERTLATVCVLVCFCS